MSKSPAIRVVLWGGLLIAAGIAVVASVRPLLGRRGASIGRAGSAAPAAAPAARPAPEFALTERSGRTVTRADLDGKVWIADFIFTRCGSTCPTLTREMAKIRRRLDEKGAGDVLSVTFTVDPVFDTPRVLAEYAGSFQADAARWLFLTGEPARVLHIVKDGFQVAMSDPSEAAPTHSNRFLLVDSKGLIRGSHLGTEDGVAETVVAEALALREEVGR